MTAPNRLLHHVEVEDALTVETVGQLRDALMNFIGPESAIELDNTYRVELLCERLSDKSPIWTIRIRQAETIT